MWSTKIPPAGLSCYPASLCYLLEGSRRLEPLSVRKGHSLHIRLCIMFSIFVDFDGYKRGPTSRHDVGMRYKEIVTLRRTYTLGNYCLKLGQVNVPLSPVLLFKIWRGHFPRARRAKIRQASPPPFVGGMVRVHNFGSNYITGDERGKKKR